MKVAYLTNGMASTLNSSLELSRRLSLAGHEVTYLSPADVGADVEAEGYAFVPLREDRRFREAAERVGLSWRGLLVRPDRWFAGLRERRRIRRRSVESREIERALETLVPDVVLIDMEMHYAIVSTAALGLPTLLPIVWFTLFRHRGLPPMHRDMEPGSGGLQRLKIDLAWLRLRLETLHLEWRRRARRLRHGDLFAPVAYDTVQIGDLRALARAKGYDLGRETDPRQWLRPHLYRHLPILCFNAREMELPHDAHRLNHYVGPMVRRDRGEARVEDRSRRAWRRFRDERGDARPLVYCSLGTYWSADEAFLRRVLTVFDRRPDWDLVLGLGGTLEAAALSPVPANALLLDYAPQLEVLAEADCAITHGGITTINECLAAGVPLVVYSTGHVDQNGCAVRVSYHGLGRVGDKDADDAARLEQNVEHALADPTIRRNVEAMRRRFQEYRQPDVAVELIERIAASADRGGEGGRA